MKKPMLIDEYSPEFCCAFFFHWAGVLMSHGINSIDAGKAVKEHMYFVGRKLTVRELESVYQELIDKQKAKPLTLDWG